MKKEALRLRIVNTISSAGLADVKSDRVKQGKIYCLQVTTWEIDKATSGGNTRCRLFIDGHGYKHYFGEQDGPSANTLYWWKEPIWLVPGEALGLEVDQAQASTAVNMYATGYWVQAGEGIG